MHAVEPQFRVGERVRFKLAPRWTGRVVSNRWTGETYVTGVLFDGDEKAKLLTEKHLTHADFATSRS